MPKQKWTNTKQYCAEPEADLFDSWYRKSDMYLEYMNEAPCKVPKIDQHADSFEALEVIENIELPAHRLTGKVRFQYFNFIEKLLLGNYETWSKTTESYGTGTFTLNEIKRCAENIEMKAVQSCMVMSLYRNYILKAISQIRKETNSAVLHPSLINMKFHPIVIKKECSNASVQTDPVEDKNDTDLLPVSTKNASPLCYVAEMSLDEKIKQFENNLNMLNSKSSNPCNSGSNLKGDIRIRKKIRNGSSSCRLNETGCTTSPVVKNKLQPLVHASSLCTPTDHMMENEIKMPATKNREEDDHILRELEAMFNTRDDGNIFETCENQTQINAIINEIEQFDPSVPGESMHATLQIETKSRQMCTPSPSFKANNDLIEFVSESATDSGKKADLRKSLWPCEFHMQKMKLRNLLSSIADTNYLKYERIRATFVTLFGEYEDEEDELGPYSPSIELNEILISSCRQRIAKWVVQALMKPLKEGLIGNRFLFKRLAKHLADCIIFLDQYPDQRFIRNYIVDYFCSHPAIMRVEDMV